MLDDRALGDLLLHRDGGDVLAAGGDDDVLLAAGYRKPAVLIERAEVAGLEPAVGGERFGGLLGEIVIAAEHVRAAHLHLAVVRDAHRRAGGGLADRADLVVVHACHRKRRRGLRHTVSLDHRQADAGEEVRQIGAQRSPAARHIPDVRAECAANRAVHRCLEHRVPGALAGGMLASVLLGARPFAGALGGLREYAPLETGAGLA